MMDTLIVNQQEVSQLLPMKACMELMAETLMALACGEAINPLRHGMWLPDKSGVLGLMPAYLRNIQRIGVKAVSVFPDNEGTEYESHQGAVLLFEAERGRLLAIVDASEITAIRTAAVSGVATQLLAREEAADLTILGSGVQARTHLEAMLFSRPVKRVRVWSRKPENGRAFAHREARRHGVQVDFVESAQTAVSGADIICTTTCAKEPILRGAWLSPGVHINAVGSSVSFARELDTTAVTRSRLYVDRRESTLNEAGDFLIPKGEGAIDDTHIQGEIGDILLKRISGRETAEEITLFKSLGLAVEDVAAAQHVYRQALETGRGLRIDLGGRRHDTA